MSLTICANKIHQKRRFMRFLRLQSLRLYYAIFNFIYLLHTYLKYAPN